jgi:predicted NBD/HSP70 family sugar kinase
MQNNLPHLEAFIVSHLVSSGPAAFKDLKTATRVSSPTLMRALQNLSETKWISPIGRAKSTGGRPATVYGLEASVYALLGIQLELPGVRLVLTSLEQKILTRIVFSLQGYSPSEVVSAIASKVSRVQKEYSQYRILGAGLATPGYVDSENGEILFVGRAPTWQNFPIKDRLQVALGLPVVVENDIDCMARVEQRTLGLKTDFLYVGFIEGIKASLYLREQFYKGPYGNAGLIGHTIVDREGQVCRCGKRGCLETIASIQSVCDRFDRQVQESQQNDETIRQIKSCDDNWQKFRAIAQAAESKHPLCAEIMAAALNALALALSNLISIVQVNLLVLGGALGALPMGLREQLDKELRKNLPSLLSHRLIIHYASATSEDIAALGAAQQFLQYLLSMDGVSA